MDTAATREDVMTTRLTRLLQNRTFSGMGLAPRSARQMLPVSQGALKDANGAFDRGFYEFCGSVGR